MEYLKKGLRTTVNSIKRHRLLFALIVILQIIFVVSSLALGTQYLFKVLEDAQGIIVPLENANYDSQKIEQGESFTPDYASIYNSYRSMLKNVFLFLAGLAVLFLSLNGSIWLLSHWMLQERQQWRIRLKEGAQFLLKAWAAALLLLGPFAIISYYVLLHFIRISQSFTNIAIVLKSLLIALLVIYYFFLVALAVAPHKPWKRFALTWIEFSISKFQKTVIAFFLIAVALLASFSVLYAAIEYGESVTLLLFLGLFCMVMVSLTRIFWIAAIQEIKPEKKDETSHH
ncbi:MAG: hypothetical protein Q7S55_04020 [Nanoarchaeota archaeon]|nr:hypothetical protein [Nanoarchaeota archaeon]